MTSCECCDLNPGTVSGDDGETWVCTECADALKLGALKARLMNVDRIVSHADWQKWGQTPQSFSAFCAEILHLIDIDRLT